ncbi:MAG TPA: VacJ family lipoprotein, partial [Rhizomicrobium sp.]|nr:VacJ family lipoprotein [Rhizomicrobium sp.]
MLQAIASVAIMWAAAGVHPASADSLNDPYESTNRSFYASHQALYRNVIGPVVTFYNNRVPEPARNGMHNFLVNIDLPVTFGNDLLQGEIVRSGETVARFVVNCTAGIGGLLDVAGKIGIHEHQTGFADTMASYGVGKGPYLYLPLIGPSVPRELAGKIVDTAFDPLTYVSYGASIFVSVGRSGATYMDKRARGAATADEIEKNSNDPYATTRVLYGKHLAAEENRAAPGSDYDDDPAGVRLAVQNSSEAVVSTTSLTSRD